MKTFSKEGVGIMIQHSTMAKPKESILKVTILVRMKIYPQKMVGIMSRIQSSDYNA